MIARVTRDDLDDLLPLMRGYCDFYEVAPSDAALRALSLTLIANPDTSGVQLIAREDGGSGRRSASPPSTGPSRRSRPPRSA